jgi:hypothetical protein
MFRLKATAASKEQAAYVFRNKKYAIESILLLLLLELIFCSLKTEAELSFETLMELYLIACNIQVGGNLRSLGCKILKVQCTDADFWDAVLWASWSRLRAVVSSDVKSQFS